MAVVMAEARDGAGGGVASPGVDGAVALPPRLSMRGITKRFGGTLALSHVDFDVRAGEIHGLVGHNGAGKSTLMKILAGDYRADGGTVLVDGQEVDIRDPRRGLELGVGIVYQELSLLPNLTVAENVSLGREASTLGVLARRPARELAAEALASLGIRHVAPGTRVGRLSLAEQQLVEIAKVLSEHPRILVLDEPTASLSLDDTRRLFASLRHLRERGVGIVFVSHRYGEVLEICDRCTVLRNGQTVAQEDVAGLTVDRLVALTLGEATPEGDASRRRGRTAAQGERRRDVLSVANLSVGGAVRDVSFSVAEGELVGLCGLLGSGQSEVARALYGDAADVTGTVAVDGRRVRLSSPRAALRAGIAFITENRRDEGIFPDLPVVDNVGVASLRTSWVSRHVPLVSARRERARARAVLRQVSVAPQLEPVHLRFLSGGNQQKVVVARWLLRGARLLVCNEPTRGVDVGARLDIYEQLRALADGGAGILVVTTDIDEALMLCDRILVCHAGRITAEVDPAEADEEALFLALQGRASGDGHGG